MQNPPCKPQRDVKREGRLVRAFLCGRDSAAAPNPGGVQGPEALRQPLKRREHISDTWWASSLKTRGLNTRIYILLCINTELYTVINKQQLPGVAEMAPLSPRRRCFILLCLAAIQISQAAVQVRVVYYSVLFLMAVILWQKSCLFPVTILRLVSKFSLF